MRKTYLLLLVFASIFGNLCAQNSITATDVVSDFENLSLGPNTYWNGADFSGGFASGFVHFPNDYDSTWGAWNNWAYSNMADDTTAGWLNQFSAITAEGYDPSASGGKNYGLAFVSSDFISTHLIPVSIDFLDWKANEVKGFYVTNTTFAGLSMEQGDQVSKKFGGETGDDPDYFKLMIWGILNGQPTDTVDFFLSDYRFPDNANDYIVKSWEWVNLESLGEVDKLMFSMESSDIGMFGINTPTYFCIDNLTVVHDPSAYSEYIADVIEYTPAPGQQINAAPWGLPASVQSIIGGHDGSLSLGAFGGYTIFRFDHAVENHPDNPFGVDFSIFGNPMEDASEPGQVYVMEDENWNGLPDDTWYLLAGSDYWFSNSVANYEVTYDNPGSHDDVPWTDNLGNSGFIFANSIHEQPYYPDSDSFPSISPDQYMLQGGMIRGAIDSSSPAFVKSPQRAFGYADNRLRGGTFHTFPDNPYTNELEGSGGDAFDISWAVDSNGNYVELGSIHFIKVQTGMMGDAGWLGEISTEITGAVDVSSEPGTIYDLDMIVIMDLPIVIDSTHFQIEAFVFHAGHPQPEAEIVWETNVSWASIDENNLLTVSQSGELLITASMESDPDIKASASTTIELPAGIPEFANSQIHAFPNPAKTHITIAGAENTKVEIFDVGGMKVFESERYSNNELINVEAFPRGLYLVRIFQHHQSVTVKFIKQ